MRRLGLAMGTGLLALVAAGCNPPYDSLLLGTNGQPIRSKEVLVIINDATTTEDQKRQALLGLGITDPRLIELLIREGSSPAQAS